MSDHTVLADEIKTLLSNRLGLEISSFTTDLFEGGILDSMGFVELLLQLENNYGIRLALEEIEFDNFSCVEKIAAFVASRADQKPLELISD